jgi:integrase/recombinase XerD
MNKQGSSSSVVEKQQQSPRSLNEQSQWLQRKIKMAITDDGLIPSHAARLLREHSETNALTICDYILAMKTEVNPTVQYRQITIQVLCYLSRFCGRGQKPFKDMVRNDIVSYLDSLRKTEFEDPQHKYVGTYNLRRVIFLRFFKWLDSPHLPHEARPTPAMMQNIPKLRRKEITTIKPSDLWNDEDHAIFLKYCNNKRDRAYHAIAMDSSCRPSEILNLRIKDLSFKRTVDNKQYAQITVNGKTGTRNIPLFAAIPYVKDWLAPSDNNGRGREGSAGHPQPGNPDAFLIPTIGKKRDNIKRWGNKMHSPSMNEIYHMYKHNILPKALDNPTVPAADKEKIRALLAKPHNPYIQRHSALTVKAKKLTAPVLKQHAGWQPGSKMETKYLHFLGAESNDTILSEIYGLETVSTLKSKKMSQILVPRICPNCNESNISDSKFCSKCRMVLTYDAYSETIEEQTKKDKQIDQMQQQMLQQQTMLNDVMQMLKDITKDKKQFDADQKEFQKKIVEHKKAANAEATAMSLNNNNKVIAAVPFPEVEGINEWMNK